MSGLMQGKAVYHDGSFHAYTIGASEQIKAARAYPEVTLDNLAGSSLAVEYVAFMIYSALKRQQDETAVNIGFDSWAENLADPGLIEDPEGESLPPRTV